MSLKNFAKTGTVSTPPKSKAATSPVPAPEAPPPTKYPSTMLPRINARVSKKSERRIRELALEEDCTVQELIVRGLSALFVERGLEPLDEAGANG